MEKYILKISMYAMCAAKRTLRTSLRFIHTFTVNALSHPHNTTRLGPLSNLK